MSGVLLYLVVLTSLFGTKVAGRNFGIMATWVIWMFLLTVVLTPLGGRVWCMSCPLPVFGDFLQRGTLTGVRKGRTKRFFNHFSGWNRSWPQWLAVGMLVLATAYSLVHLGHWTLLRDAVNGGWFTTNGHTLRRRTPGQFS